MAAFFAGGTLAVMGATVYWLKDALHNSFFLTAAAQAAATRTALQESLDRHVRDFDGMAASVSADPDFSLESFRRHAVRALRDCAGFKTLHFLDTQFRAAWTFPFAPPPAGTLHGLDAAARRAVALEQTAASGVVDEDTAEPSVLLFTPVFRPRGWAGLLEAILPSARIASLWLDPALSTRFDYQLIEESQGRDILSFHHPRGTAVPDYDSYFTLEFADRTWWMILHPLHPPRVLLWVALALFWEALAGTSIVYLWWRRSQP